MGIEPTSDSDCRSTVLKTAPPTRTDTPPPVVLPVRVDRTVARPRRQVADILMRVIDIRSLALIAILAVSACSGSSGPHSLSGSNSIAPTPSPASPRPMTEQFTPLPCNGTTIGDEGCAERDVLRADALINHDMAILWRRAITNPERTRLVSAQDAWIGYRAAACVSEADAFAGGSEAAVVAAQCLARLTRQRAAELAAQIALVP